MKKALMIVAMVAIVATAGSLVYYFVFFRPGIAKAEIRLREQKVQSSEVTVVTTKSETEVDKFNEELKDLVNFIDDYSALKGNYEDEWLIVPSNSINKKLYTSDEIIKLQGDELNAIKGLLVFPESVTKYIEYDISYIEARGNFYGVLAVVIENFKRPVAMDEVYPEFSKDLDNMGNLLKKREAELRNIKIDFNNRAKELGLPIPFPNK
ncbi:MAG: hypothetical protein ACYDIA_00710 [Candidatus Humimicrobiaceae bacterium]